MACMGNGCNSEDSIVNLGNENRQGVSRIGVGKLAEEGLVPLADMEA